MPYKYELSSSFLGNYYPNETEPKDELEQVLSDIFVDKICAKIRATEDAFDFKSYYEEQEALDAMSYKELEAAYGETFAINHILASVDETLAALDQEADAYSAGGYGDPFAFEVQEPAYTFELGYTF